MYAEIYWLTTEEGGRKNPIIPQKSGAGFSYRANTQTMDDSAWSVVAYFDNQEPVQLGTTGKYTIGFLSLEALGVFYRGCPIHICEGSTVVGRGTIL